MAKKKAAEGISIKSMADAQKALEEMEKIELEIAPQMRRATELKKAVTAFAVKKNIPVVQLDGVYYRHIQRNTHKWIPTDEDMPGTAPKGAKSVMAIVKGRKVKIKGKSVPLWQLITKRVVDPQLIDQAVTQGHITEKEIEKAYVATPQAPFLQRYTGEADDG